MANWKTLLAVAIVALVLIACYPIRQLEPEDRSKKVTEIVFMGPNTQVYRDVFKAFERWSAERHAKDPSKPIYRVVSGQAAARDMVADPQRFLVATAGGAPPDVVYFDRFAVAEWAGRGAFEPLNHFLDVDARTGQRDPPPPTSDRFYPACWNEANYQGQCYAIPASVDDRAFFYSKDLFVRAGLVDAKGEARPPQSWEELRDDALRLTTWTPRKPTRPAIVPDQTELAILRALARGANRAKLGRDFSTTDPGYLDTMWKWWSNPDRTVQILGFIPNFGNSWLYIYGWMNGGEFMSPDGKTVTLNDPKIVEALQYMRDIYDDLGGYKYVQGFQAGFQGNELDPFITGKVAMKIDGVWALSWVAYYGKDMNFGVAPPPRPQKVIDELVAKEPDPKKKARAWWMSWNGGWAYAIPKTARRKEGAWDFIRFMTSEKSLDMVQEANRALTEAQGRIFLPAQSPQWRVNERNVEKYVLSNPKIRQTFKDGERMYNDLLPYARYRPVTPVGQRLWNEHVRAMENAMYPGMTPKQALDAGNAVVQEDLNKFIKPIPGRPIKSWTWFFLLYGVLLIAVVVVVYQWDTRIGIRRKIAALLRLPESKVGDVVAGARGGFFRAQWPGGWICALPWIIGFIIFGGGPMLFSLIISFTDYDILKPPVYIGLANYHTLFFSDQLFGKAMLNTLFMVIGVPLGMIASLSVALLLNAKIKGMAAWRTLFYLPAIVPMVAASLLWVWIFNPQGGALNQMLDWLHITPLLEPVLKLFHISTPIGWLQDEMMSKPSIIIRGLWGAGAGMIIWLAGLKAIPNELYEAADVDGANEWQKFWSITIPQLTPYIFFNLVMGMIGVFQIFGEAFIMTAGGPKDSTLFYVYHLFNNAFRYGHMGMAAAMAWILFPIILIITLIQFLLAKRWVYYEAD